MEEIKKKEASSKEPDKPKVELTEEQLQRRKKLIVYPLMVIVFAVAMWLIFAPSEKEEQQEQKGFNTEVPTGTDTGLIGDKQDAYEKEQLEAKEQQRKGQMQDLAALFGAEADEEKEPYLAEQPSESTSSYGSGGGSSRPKETIYASANAYKDINRTLGNFYEDPKVDEEKEDMRKELEELREMAYNRQTEKETVDDQFALLEKSYQLAAKYMPSGGQSSANTHSIPAEDTSKPKVTERNGKALMTPVAQVKERTVSSLSQPMSDVEFAQEYSVERNLGFHTAVGTTTTTEKNTIKACVNGNQTVLDGEGVRLRLLEAMRAGETILPRNSLITGVCKITGERLKITIQSLEYGGTIIPVSLTVFDADGQEGIFIPGSMEMNAVKEIAANMGSSLGSSINISTDAGAQLASDLGKGVIQGTSQYIAKKMRTVKVHLKSGYNLMLYQNKQ